MRYDTRLMYGESAKSRQESLVPIATLLLKQTKGEFLTPKEKVRVKEYEAEQRNKNKNKSKSK